MPILKRHELSAKLNDPSLYSAIQLYLFFGERYLCQKAADELQQTLLNKNKGTVNPIDGDQEDGALTLNKLMSFSLLPGIQVFRVNDTKLFLSKTIGQSIWQKALQAYKSGKNPLAAKHIGDMYHLAGLNPLEERLSELTDDQWQYNFSVSKPEEIEWTDKLMEHMGSPHNKSSNLQDLPQQYMNSFTKGIPKNNILILTTENLDKRKKFFQFIKDNGIIIDCSVAEGGSTAAQKSQKSVLIEMIQSTLSRFNKSMDKGALEIFFERIGFHPVAVVMETEKLALYCDDKSVISLRDVDQMVGRTREDALFELTDNLGKRKIQEALITLSHLMENGVHGLAILATLRNYLRKLILFRSIQMREIPVFHKGMSPKQFQDDYLPQLKNDDDLTDLLKGHPYALYMNFKKAAEYQIPTLKSWLGLLLEVEFKLKGSGISEQLVLENLLITLIKKPIPHSLHSVE